MVGGEQLLPLRPHPSPLFPPGDQVCLRLAGANRGGEAAAKWRQAQPASRHQVVAAKVGRSGVLGLAAPGDRRARRRVSGRRRRRLPQQRNCRSHLPHGCQGPTPLGPAQGPLDDLAVWVHALRPKIRNTYTEQFAGYEADMLSSAGIESHFQGLVEPMLRSRQQFVGRSLKVLHIDSYRSGPTWPDCSRPGRISFGRSFGSGGATTCLGTCRRPAGRMSTARDNRPVSVGHPPHDRRPDGREVLGPLRRADAPARAEGRGRDRLRQLSAAADRRCNRRALDVPMGGVLAPRKVHDPVVPLLPHDPHGSERGPRLRPADRAIGGLDDRLALHGVAGRPEGPGRRAVSRA